MTNGNVIGYVSKQSGEATLTKINGEVVELGIFSQIHKNDLIESVDGTSIEVVMTNGNVVNIDGQRTLLIDETVYEAKSFKQDEVSKESVEAVEKGDISQLEATEAGEQKVGTSQNISDAFTNRGVDDGFAQAEGLLIGLETSLADTNPDELEEDQIDSLSPNAPFINPIALGNDDTPTITGKAEADSEVSIIIDGKVVDVVIADGNGDWSYTTDTLSDGEHLVSAISTDATGNSREASENTSFIIDTQAPDSPIINELGSTNDTTPTLTGEGEVGSTIVISINSEIVGETTVAENGQWTYTLEDVLREGDYAISATSTDKAGNTSYASITSVITIDTSLLDPDVTDADIQINTGSDSVLNSDEVNTVSISGTTEAGSTINITVTDSEGDTVVYEGTADSTGNWSDTVDLSTLVDGDLTFTGSVTDINGNTSVLAPVTVSKDTTLLDSDNDNAGVLVSIDGISPDNGIENDFQTNLNDVTLYGTFDNEVDTSLVVTINEIEQEITIDGKNWSVDFISEADATYPIIATVTDAAG
ncbi:MAG TPA: hypothetical protein EYO73_02630, partial [Sulfurimonas sp.]|nr:hypothetical protein [Sulfurimonas sp.]